MASSVAWLAWLALVLAAVGVALPAAALVAAARLRRGLRDLHAGVVSSNASIMSLYKKVYATLDARQREALVAQF